MLLLQGMHHTVVTFIHLNLLANERISIEVVLGLHLQTSPRAQVTPTEVGRADEDFLNTLHDCVVYRDILALWIDCINHLLLIYGSVDWHQVLKYLGYCGLIHSECVDDSADTPDKDTGIPEVVALFDIFLSGFKIGFLLELVHTENFLLTQRTDTQVGLDIAITRLRTVGLHAQGYDGIRILGEVHAELDDAAELFDIGHYMVTGSNHHIGLGVL